MYLGVQNTLPHAIIKYLIELMRSQISVSRAVRTWNHWDTARQMVDHDQDADHVECNNGIVDGSDRK
jgi:hypothetical protein